jgi:hypothetical protein
MTNSDPQGQTHAEPGLVSRIQEEELLRSTERSRLRSLVGGDIEAAQMLHAEDFQLVNPGGGLLSKEQYLGGIASGTLDYQVWEPDSEIAVRLHGNAAAIRYRLASKLSFGAKRFHLPATGTPTFMKSEMAVGK